MSDQTFSSDVIAHEYLRSAAPETVYAWLKSKAGEVTPLYFSPIPAEFLRDLLARGDVIINLGIASVATDHDILTTLWHMNNPAIRLAVAGNIYRDSGISGILNRHAWAGAEGLTAELEAGAMLHLTYRAL